MNALSRLLLVTLLATAATKAPGQVYQGKRLVEANAVANVSAVVPGEPFLVGVRLKMAPGWHTYWKYPGDAGIPTDIKWQLPEGWRAGETQWPVPLKLQEPGDIQIYGYHDDVLLIQQITPAKTSGSGEAKLSAKVTWLVCEKICIPGNATVELPLPIAGTNNPANTELFARTQKQLPRSRGANFSATWSRDKSGLLLKVRSPDLPKYSSVEFFPAPAENVAVGHPQLESRKDDQFVFRVPLDNPNQNSLPGLIVFGEGDDRGALEISGASQPLSGTQTSSTRELARFLLFGLIGGLILNLMPCVLPVISLKIFGFVQQAGQSRARIFRSGLAFVAGIFVWFIGLALVLIGIKAAGGQPVWAAQFTSPYFVMIMSAVVLVFALNLFGVFEVNLPQWISRRAVAAEWLMAMPVHFSMACSPPSSPRLAPRHFSVPRSGFAFTQSPVVIFLMFASIALGMSLPYFLLSAQPAWLRFYRSPARGWCG